MVSCWGSGEVAGVIDTAESQVRGKAVAGSNDSSHVDRPLKDPWSPLCRGGNMDEILNQETVNIDVYCDTVHFLETLLFIYYL